MKVRSGNLVELRFTTVFSECGSEGELLGGVNSEVFNRIAIVLFVMEERQSDRGSKRTLVLSSEGMTGWIWDSWIKAKFR